MSDFSPQRIKDGVIGRPSLWIAEDFWVLRFRLMVKRGPWLRPQASEGEAQHGPFCWIGRIGRGDQHRPGACEDATQSETANAADPGCVKTLSCCYDSPVILWGNR